MSDRREGPERLPGSRARVRAMARRYSTPVLLGLVVLGFVFTTALVLTRGSGVRLTPLAETDIGQVAKVDIRATSSLYVRDDATTLRLRNEAARAAPLVYILDSSIRHRNVRTLHNAFRLIRVGFDAYDKAVADAHRQLARRKRPSPPPLPEKPGVKPKAGKGAAPRKVPATKPKGPETKAGRGADAPAGAEAETSGQPDVVRESDIVAGSSGRGPAAIPRSGPGSRMGKRLPKRLHAPLLKRLTTFLVRKKRDFTRLIPVSDADFDALAKMRFSPLVENLAVGLLSMALDNVVVRDKVKLLIDVSRGVKIGVGGSSQLSPINKVLNPADALDVQGARARITERAGDLLSKLPASLRDTIASTARRLVQENLVFDAAVTARVRNKARSDVPDQFRKYPRGSTLVRKGDVITADHIQLVRQLAPTGDGTHPVRTFFGNVLLLCLFGGLGYLATRLRVVRRKPRVRDYVFLASALLFTVALIRISVEVSEALHSRWENVPLSVFVLAIPVAAGAMLVRLMLSAELSILFSFLTALLAGLLQAGNLYFGAYVFIGCFAASLVAGKARQRTHLLRAGLAIGLIQLGAVLSLTLLSGRGTFPLVSETSLVSTPSEGLFAVTFLLDLGAGLLSGIVAGLICAALVPVVEGTFRYTTDMKYMELANLENPLLKDLFLRAPGTYHHSVVAGTLAEAAAEAIGANQHLARVGAYYHDVGKGKCPHYFAENQRGENPHDKLSPHMSALILKMHVKDGVDILKHHKLPTPIVDICEQHLGTTLIEYFFVKAKRRSEEEEGSAPEESDFRYPGPKPQFRESALVLLSDTIEAAARSIPEPTQPKLDEMVRRLIRKKFIDGQLDECDLTLRDLDSIARAMTPVLVAIHHTRPQYPGQRGGDQKQESAKVVPPAPVDIANRRRQV